jgi:hypothetical protein
MTKSHRLLEFFTIGFVLLLGIGYFTSKEFQDFLGYALVLFAASLPVALWINSGTGGIPIFPTAALLYWLYFGVPAMRGVGERAGYSPQHVLDAEITIALFLFVATAAWFHFLRPSRAGNAKAPAEYSMNKRAVVSLVMIGLGMGAAFYALTFSNFANIMGSATGVIRAVLLAPMLLACYFLGYGTAKRMFSGVQLAIAAAVLLAIFVVQLSGLQIITEATEMGAALMGYIYTARRIPWVTILAVAAIVSVFQAGKAEIRARYGNIDISPQMTPALVSQWLGTGFSTITSNAAHQGVADRAALLNQIIRIEVWTPSHVPYLEGETYAYLPSMLVPRIFNPDRAPTQVVMHLLDVRYGFLSRGQTRTTFVGINIISEAFANFGYLGVIAIGALFGLFTGYFERLSSDQEATSLPTLLAIATMVTVLDLEADLSYLATTLFQSGVAIVVFYYSLRFVFGTRRPAIKFKETA